MARSKMTDDQWATVRHIHTIETQRFNERRRLEWRLSFTIWATLAAIAALLPRIEALKPKEIATTFTLVAVAALLLHGFLEWRYFKITRTNWWQGVELAKSLRDHAGLETASLPEQCSYRWFASQGWQVAVSVGITLALTAAFWLATG